MNVMSNSQLASYTQTIDPTISRKVETIEENEGVTNAYVIRAMLSQYVKDRYVETPSLLTNTYAIIRH